LSKKCQKIVNKLPIHCINLSKNYEKFVKNLSNICQIFYLFGRSPVEKKKKKKKLKIGGSKPRFDFVAPGKNTVAKVKVFRHLEAWVLVGRGIPHAKDFVSLSALRYSKKQMRLKKPETVLNENIHYIYVVPHGLFSIDNFLCLLELRQIRQETSQVVNTVLKFVPYPLHLSGDSPVCLPRAHAQPGSGGERVEGGRQQQVDPPRKGGPAAAANVLPGRRQQDHAVKGGDVGGEVSHDQVLFLSARKADLTKKGF
jgi:hypothetical protein